MKLRIGKEIGKTLLSRSNSWKREVHRQNRDLVRLLLGSLEYDSICHCMVCQQETVEILVVDEIPYAECTNCNHLQATIRPKPDFLKRLYTTSTEGQSTQDQAYVDISPIERSTRITDIAYPKVDFVSSNIEYAKQDLWIDIGSGTGEVLVCAKDFGFRTMGIETSLSESAIAENSNIENLNIFFDGSQEITQFKEARVISFFNVVEHMTDPVEVIRRTLDQMTSGAYLIIEVPRHNSISSVVQKSFPKVIYRHIFSPEHLNIFSDKSLEIMLTEAGADKIACWYFGSDALEIFSFVMNALDDQNEADLEKYFSEINRLQASIDAAGMSDVMLVIAQRR